MYLPRRKEKHGVGLHRIGLKIDGMGAVPFADIQQDIEIVLVRPLNELVLPQMDCKRTQVEIAFLLLLRMKVLDLVDRQMFIRHMAPGD